MRAFRSAVVVASLILIGIAPVASAAKKSLGIKLRDAALGSAAGKGAEFAVKLAGGLLYDNVCPPKTPSEKAAAFLCSTLGSVTGRADEEWQAKVDEKLGEISNQLKEVDKNLEKIQGTLLKQHEAMDDQFNQVSVNVAATKVLVRVENLWERFQAQVQNPKDLRKDALVTFAKEIAVTEKLHTKLGDLNAR
ncbi:MAG TPA: hypothetical protein VJZ00_20675 [Thermoanaerobaculia bacterium]|nr:hypothetical protein [Thermoanaerobaculia bacterium]